ncbi:hypothetical protein RN001_004168 [Aquatica leii]|uniref:Carboxylesterase type B domain-containing protein n=1 Tax=Aquatica leii TaxID=1421715 RepID=A0AAN7SL79_9COLE|nr:hypothetical protein RN001_004168 [Aquatica leii]
MAYANNYSQYDPLASPQLGHLHKNQNTTTQYAQQQAYTTLSQPTHQQIQPQHAMMFYSQPPTCSQTSSYQPYVNYPSLPNNNTENGWQQVTYGKKRNRTYDEDKDPNSKAKQAGYSLERMCQLVIALASTKSCEVLKITKYGPICGTIKNSRAANSSVRYYYFTGVPYARPPLGDLRFKEAQPPEPWYTPKDATKQGNVCTQITDLFMGNDVIGSEDCLTLEIAAPLTVSDSNCSGLPVMVWIHGGSFIFSSYQNTGSDYFMEKPVVIVSINYRLNVFGFLSTLNNDAPGNMGLKDQTAALIWIQENIKVFGGDPSKVTIFGGSAGGASVQFHLLSPRSKGLFHRAISQSGVTLNTWVFQRYPKEMAFRLGRGLGIYTKNTAILVEKLRQVPADKLVKTGFNASIMGSYILFDEVPFIPSIEHRSPNAFFSDYAYEALRKGVFTKVPYMIGHVTEEGSFPYEYIDTGYININIFEENPALFIPISMNIPNGSPCIDHTIRRIKEHFFKNTSFTDKTNWIKFMGQDVRGFRKSADLVCQNQKHNVYFYVYAYVGTNPLSYLGGAGHYSEVLKLFYPINPVWTTKLTDSDRVVQKKLLKLWTDFATTGDPTPDDTSNIDNVKWPVFCENKEYVEIGNELRVKSNPDYDIYQFWENAFRKCVLKITKYGPICGTIKNSRAANSSVRYYYFTGVPYARPPLGDLRFKEAQPPEPWYTPKDATKQGNVCTQITDLFMGNDVIGSEDCLTLEIAAPLNVSDSNCSGLPVMVWIHGGSFIFSSYQNTGSDYFMEKPVVIVSINYRLNVFGFLSTLNNDAPGNMGLKDQTAALIWIQENIEVFGGDPSKVTIFGGSAGGASVQFHLLSPRSRGLFHRAIRLFHRAISQSGVTLNTWAFQRYPKEMAFRLGRGLGIHTTNTAILVEKLRQVPADRLVKTGFNASIMGSYILFDEVPFIPSIEHRCPNAFFSDHAYEALRKGVFTKVPYMIGHVTEEGSFAYDCGAGHYSEVLKLFYPINPVWTTKLTDSDRVVQKKLLKLWTDFATTGDPTPDDTSNIDNVKWPVFCENKEYVEIGNELRVKSNPDYNTYQFWENAFRKCGRRPYNTY